MNDVCVTAEKLIISGSIKRIRELAEVQEFDFSVSVATQGKEFSNAKRDVVNKLLLATLVELAKEDMQ